MMNEERALGMDTFLKTAGAPASVVASILRWQGTWRTDTTGSIRAPDRFVLIDSVQSMEGTRGERREEEEEEEGEERER